MREQTEGRSFEEAALNYLDKNKAKFGLKGSMSNNLKHHFTYKGGEITVVRFQQMYKGLPVDDNQIIVTMNRAKEIIFLLNYTRPVREDIKIQSQVNGKTALFTAISAFGPIQIPPKVRNEKIIHFSDEKPALCYRVRFSLNAPIGDWITFVDAHSNTVIRRYNNLHSFQTSSGTGTGNVFNPDPISTSGAAYGTGGFVHGNDANTTDLQGQLMSVTFPVGNQFEQGPTYLRGTRAYHKNDPTPCYSNTLNWSFDRSDDCFEAVMCYFHIDKVMAHYYSYGTAALSPYQNPSSDDKAVRFEVVQALETTFAAAYNSGGGFLHFAKFENAQGQTMDAAEDAAVIIHELGHGINDWMAPGGISTSEGLGEGFADYWSMSYTRSLGLWNENEPQYHRVCNWYMFNDVLPANENRTTDFEEDYTSQDFANLPPHSQGQLFSTAMMRIWDDIGKDKTDYIAIKGIALTGSETEQWEAAEAIFGAAEYAKDENVNIKNAGIFITATDLCIIYQHFRDIYGTEFNPTPPEGVADYYIRDTPADLGTEPNPDQGPVWLSGDIWIRSGDDDGETIQIHENPVYGQNNYIYVRLRSRGCMPLTQGSLRVYFSKSSTVLTWPDFWEDYFVQSPGSGTVVTGDEVDSSPIALPDDMRAGEERIIKFLWGNMPDPGDFHFDRHHFSLLARIESTQDPMTSTETSDVLVNIRSNNNIAGKSVSILGGTPLTNWGTLFESTVFTHQSSATSALTNNIQVTSPTLPGYVPCQAQGELFILLRDSLHTIWQNNGGEGEGFALQTDGRLKMTGGVATIEGLTMAVATPYYLTVQYSPDTNALPCICDVKQINSQGMVVGGERFIYDPEAGESSPREAGKDYKQTRQSLRVYPVPASGLLQVEFDSDQEQPEARLVVYDSRGILHVQKNVAIQRARNRLSLEVEQLPKGFYYLQIAGADNQLIGTARFIKL
ncbi:MAG: hypothetical protein DYG98_09235 [Haliscomenobacteraceae bacterium CHB4]|nr:hypothetical protein [Saprospiraceae bacterium]MCE7923229.1 hypothetical protein [Haliscomenobacteraceae bacterium CHB4]